MHKPVIIAACSLFAIAFIGDLLLWQPYSTAGYFLCPPLLIIGIVLWLRFYRSSRGHYPSLKAIRKEAVFNGGVLTLHQAYLWKHKYEFWTFCFAILMVIIPLIGTTFSRSSAFTAITTYCNSTDRVKSKIGAIKYYGLLTSGTINNRNALLHFTIIGVKGNFKATSTLLNNNGTWVVKTLDLR